VTYTKQPYVGQRIARKEDRRFLTGKGWYTDDIVLQGQAYAVFVRSPLAHATVKGIDATAAREMDGVLAVLTGDDLATDKVGGVPCGWQITNRAARRWSSPRTRRWPRVGCATWATSSRW